MEVHIEMFFPIYHTVKCFEKMNASDKNYWNNCTVAHMKLKLYTPTG